MDFYTYFGIDQDATMEEVEEAYYEKIGEIKSRNDNNEIDEKEADRLLLETNRAYEVLSDEETRKEYDEWLKEQANEEEVKDKKEGRPKKTRVGLRILAVCLAGAVVGSAIGWYLYLLKKNKNDKDLTSTPSISDSYNSGSESTGATTSDETSSLVEGIVSNLPKVENYGDIKDAKLVEERATSLLEQLNNAGLYNMATNAPYTVDEIKEVILYMNGAYVPENEVDALSKVDDFLNLAIAPLNSETFIYSVGYQSGEDSFKDKVAENAKKLEKVSYVKSLLFGDSTIAPYLQWIEDQYYKMVMTTDRKECAKIYDSVMQSLAEYSFGDGFELDGVIYKENMGVGLDKINSGNMLQFLVYIIEPFRTKMTSDNYTITDKYLSANSNENKVNISYEQIAEWYSPLCSADNYEFGDQGFIKIEDYSNFASVNQINTTNALLENLYGKNMRNSSTNSLIR